MTEDRIAKANAAIREAERTLVDPLPAIMAAVRSLREPQPCPSCGNLYDHRYPCVG